MSTSPIAPTPEPVPSVESQIEAHFAELELLGKTPTARAVDAVDTSARLAGRYWPAAATTIAVLALLAVIAGRVAVELSIPLAVYGIGWIGYATWHCAGRPSFGELAERYAEHRYRRDTEHADTLAPVIDINTKGK